MGRDKASLPFGAETMLQRVVRIVSPEVDGVTVVARAGQVLLGGTSAVFDRDEFQGPLAALAAGMEGAQADQYLVAGCDQPLLEAKLIPFLMDHIGVALAVVPVLGGGLVPTFAVYHRDVIEAAKALLDSGERRLSALARHVPTVLVGEDELRSIDPDLRSFLQCNTPEEYERLLLLAGLGP